MDDLSVKEGTSEIAEEQKEDQSIQEQLHDVEDMEAKKTPKKKKEPPRSTEKKMPDSTSLKDEPHSMELESGQSLSSPKDEAEEHISKAPLEKTELPEGKQPAMETGEEKEGHLEEILPPGEKDTRDGSGKWKRETNPAEKRSNSPGR